MVYMVSCDLYLFVALSGGEKHIIRASHVPYSISLSFGR